MPKVEEIMPFTGFTDHHIRIHKKEATAAAEAPRAGR